MKNIIITLLTILGIIFNPATFAENELNVEELRLEKLITEYPELKPGASLGKHFSNAHKTNGDPKDALQIIVNSMSHALWKEMVAAIKKDVKRDDRPLYWSRLQLRKRLKKTELFQQLSKERQELFLWHLELNSRGYADAKFEKKADKKILITGFDPFFLDRHLNQSNPSGAAVMALDGEVIELDGVTAEIQSVILPVRFADFDNGMVEEMLMPHIKSVDMIATISMGRKDFDLERFPGLRRSAKAPGNLNVYTGADKENPMVPLLNDMPLDGPEFVEFSLPVSAMLKAKGAFKVIDNHKVETLNGKMEPASLNELTDEIAVSGSGGGYLSNEISYRSILLKNKEELNLPVGHIHTPRIKAFEPETTVKIIAQIREMLRLSIAEI